MKQLSLVVKTTLNEAEVLGAIQAFLLEKYGKEAFVKNVFFRPENQEVIENGRRTDKTRRTDDCARTIGNAAQS